MDDSPLDSIGTDPALIQSLVSQLGAGLAVHDANGRLLNADRQIESWYGSQNQLSGKHCCDIYRHRGVAECPVKACIDRKQTVESTLFTASFSGDARLLKMIVVPSLAPDGTLNHLLVCLLDMSKNLKADRQRSSTARQQGLGNVDAQRSERRFEAISANAQDAIIMLDHHGLVSYWNASATRIFGYTLEEVESKDIADLIIPGESREAHRNGFQEFLKTGSGKVLHQTIIVNAICSDGSSIIAELSISPVLIDGHYNALASIRNVTEREERKQKIEEKERMFNALFNSSQPMFVLDRLGHLQSVNSAFYSFSGYTNDELIGRDLRSLLDRKPDAALFNHQIIHSGHWSGEIIFKRPKDQVPVVVTINRIAASDHQGPCYVGHLQNMSESKRRERELIQLQSTQEPSYLSGGLAHDLRNILTVIQGNLSLLKHHIDPVDAKSGRLTADMQAAIQAATDLTGHLFDLTKTPAEDPQSLDLKAMIAEFVLSLSGLLSASTKIRVEPIEKPVFINVVRNELRNAMLNLAMNAMQAMPGGGELTIACRLMPGDHPDLTQFAPPDRLDYAVLTFTDTGSGIDSELQPYIFEPLYTSRETGGTGLGLTMVRRFVHNCGGHIYFDSQVDSGSRFWLLFPTPTSENTDSSRSDTTDNALLGTDRLVLVIDDELQLRNLLLNQLKELGFATLEAETIESAMAIVSETPYIDLIITDILMPGELNGVDLVLWMQDTRPDTSLLLMSGYFNSKPMLEHPELTSLPRLEKPFTQLALAGQLRSILDS